MSVAENIRARREKAGITQTQLADAVAVSQVTICKIENGLKVPSLPLSMAIAKVLECTLDELTK